MYEHWLLGPREDWGRLPTTVFAAQSLADDLLSEFGDAGDALFRVMAEHGINTNSLLATLEEDLARRLRNSQYSRCTT